MKPAAVVRMVLGLALAATTSVAGPEGVSVESLLARLDHDGAAAVLAAASKAGERVTTPLARVAIHRGDPRLALRLLEASASDAPSEETRELRAIALGLLHATLGAREYTTPDGAMRLQLQHEGDAALVPWLHETVIAARRVTEEVLGFTWTAPTYVVLVRDQQTLAEATGLPYESARTTGTLAIAKWGRVTMLSPRATESGFGWRDTVVHELAHLALTAVTADRAPLWLQEGVAKDMELRWRPREPFDERPEPEAIVREALSKREYIPLDKLGPSVAMLPSAHAAEVAFAAATSFVRYLRRELGAEGFPAYLRALGEGAKGDALAKVSGKSFSAWHAEWLASVGRGTGAPTATSPARGDAGETARRMRLARLLVQRGHAPAALRELEQADKASKKSLGRDGGWLTLHALAHEARGDGAALDRLFVEAAPATDPRGPFYRLRGARARLRGEEEAARADRAKAVAREPLGPETVCETGAAGPDAALCDAARARMAPNVD